MSLKKLLYPKSVLIVDLR